MAYQPYAWLGSTTEFSQTKPDFLLSALKQHHLNCTGEAAGGSQLTAWGQSIDVVRRALSPDDGVLGGSLILEYELPRERGRRPDVLFLSGRVLVVLEFKDFREPLQAHVDQVAAYARDLRLYHALSHDLEVVPVLVPTLSRANIEQFDEVWLASPMALGPLLRQLAKNATHPKAPNASEWVAADYQPLPFLITAARRIFNHEPLPKIRAAQSAGVMSTIAHLARVAEQARSLGERHLALVTGVPGAGKTLVGLQFVYATHFSSGNSGKHAVFLSGNGPLVDVLQHALKSSVFVQDVHGFLKQYGGAKSQLPLEHIWVYDEAQRAWDAERVLAKRQHGASEPEDFLRLGERMPDWAMLVGLIGEGQEIHLGEEAGLGQWNEALAACSKDWVVHCPPKLAKLFGAASSVKPEKRLDLNVSLRSHLASDVQRWATLLLEGKLSDAAAAAKRVTSQGFDLYLTRDLERAKEHARQRYDGEIDKRYGLLASSKAKNLPEHGVNNSWAYTRRIRIGPWFNDPPDSKFSCCRLHDVATEFQCQGLELDLPVIGWGNDLKWGTFGWQSPDAKRSKAKDPHQLRINSYRVLLTRGRDGLVVFVPPDKEMDSTYGSLLQAGVKPLMIVYGLEAKKARVAETLG